MKTGCIEITDKVRFVYHELPNPEKKDYISNHYLVTNAKYGKALNEYEASKRTIEVSNVKKVKTIWMYKYRCGYIKLAGKMVINNNPCKAEVNGTAKIIELL